MSERSYLDVIDKLVYQTLEAEAACVGSNFDERRTNFSLFFDKVQRDFFTNKYAGVISNNNNSNNSGSILPPINSAHSSMDVSGNDDSNSPNRARNKVLFDALASATLRMK